MIVLMSVAAALPYAMYTIATRQFQPIPALAIVGLAACVLAWFRVLPRNPFFDLAFLVVLGAGLLTGIFPMLYPRAAPRLRLDFLGHLMWIRTAIVAVLVFRRPENIDFGFWPRGRDWKLGVLYYLIFLPLALGLAWAIGLPHQLDRFSGAKAFAVASATFFGMLWVVALSEQFFFRGLLQQWLCRWLASDTAGLALASVAFGLVHLPYRGFPNWRFVAMTTLLGLICGLVYRRTQGIRAPMVTHALAATTWQLVS